MKTLLSIVLAVSLGASIADAAGVCVRKNGRLVLRTACRAGERPFDASGFAVAGPSGPAGPEGPAGDPGTFPLRLVDADQEEVGEIHLLYPSGIAWIQISRPPLDEPVLFFVNFAGFPSTNTGSSLVSYTSADCAGVPYIADDGADLVRAQVSGTAAYYSTALRIESLQVQSNEFDYGGAECPATMTATTRATCCENYAHEVQGYRPAVRVDLVSLGLRPPFRAVKRQETAR